MSKPDRSGVSSRSELEAVLAHIAIFEQLRPGEIGRMAWSC